MTFSDIYYNVLWSEKHIKVIYASSKYKLFDDLNGNIQEEITFLPLPLKYI